MADFDHPLLVFPAFTRAERAKRSTGGGRPKKPEPSRQAERLAPQLQRLQDALEQRRIALQGNSLGLEPEQVLVLETVGPISEFIRSVEKVEGLEWLGEYELDDIPPGDGFEDEADPDKPLKGQLFLVMSDLQALDQLRSLFDAWRKNPDAPFARAWPRSRKPLSICTPFATGMSKTAYVRQVCWRTGKSDWNMETRRSASRRNFGSASNLSVEDRQSSICVNSWRRSVETSSLRP